MQNTSDQLLELEAIKQLKARYFRSVDTFDLAGWLDCFEESCELHIDLGVRRRDQPLPNIFSLRGRQALIDYWNGNTDRVASVHHGHMPEIELLGETEARGIWAMEDIVEFADRTLHGYGHYHETYRKSGGRWRIATLHLHRLRLTEWTTT